MMTLGIGFVCRMGGARESVYERTSPYGGGLCVGRGLCVEEGSVCAGVGCLLRRECVQWRAILEVKVGDGWKHLSGSECRLGNNSDQVLEDKILETI